MRQLVSVVTEETVSYFLTDVEGTEAKQVAQVLNPGFMVGDVIETGVVLTQVLRLNGKAPKIKALGPAPAPELPPAPPAPEREKKRPGIRVSRLTLDHIVDYVADHPGCRTGDIVAGLQVWQDAGTKPGQAVSNRLLAHDANVKAGKPARLRYEYGLRGKQTVKLLYPIGGTDGVPADG